MIKLQEETINISEALNDVYSKNSGAVNVFIGTVRSRNKNKDVVRLEYEAYDQMAVNEIKKIIDEAKSKWPVDKFVVIHRKGVLRIGETAVLIAVSTPHRKESFEACAFIIDTLKETVPIWKKEIYINGEEWLDAKP